MAAGGPERVGGRLLLATPELQDPNFARTVVYMLEHSDEGALGLVLNRPTTSPVADIIPQWAQHASPPDVVFTGGPVESSGVIGLGAHTDRPSWVRPVDLNLDPDHQPDPLVRLRLFAGHAGWGPGQLDGELLAGGWYVVDGGPADVFNEEPEDLWYHVCGRQRGAMSWLAHYPDDPQLN